MIHNLCKKKSIIVRPDYYLYLSIFAFLSSAHSQDIPQPVSHWIFDATHIHENTIPDLTGDFDAVIDGEVVFADSKRKSGLYFDGKHTRVVIGEEIGALGLPAECISLESWVNIHHDIEWGAFIGFGLDTGGLEYGWYLGNFFDQFTFAISAHDRDDGDGLMTYVMAKNPYKKEKWYHIVGTYDGYEHTIYVNGKLKNQTQATIDQLEYAPGFSHYNRPAQSGPINYPDYTNFVIGSYEDHDEQYLMKGVISEVAIYDQALSAEQITSMYENGKKSLPKINYNKIKHNVSVESDELDVPVSNYVDLWSFPPNYSHFQQLSHSIIEDRNGGLWFACANFLLHQENDQWNTISFPDGFYTKYFHSDAFFIVPDGKIIIKTFPSPALLDPDQKTVVKLTVPIDAYDLMWQDENQNIFIGSYNQEKETLTTFQYDQDTFVEIEEQSFVFPGNRRKHSIQGFQVFYPISEDSFLIGNHAGIFNVQKNASSRIGEIRNLRSILRIDQNKYWFGGLNEVIEWDGGYFYKNPF